MIKVGFFGTPDIAGQCLSSICGKYETVFVVTSSDKAQGRNLKVCCTPVKECAEEECIDVFQPENLKDPEFEQMLMKYNADIFVVVAYGHLIPKNIFSMPRLGTINMHPSLLPKYRGAAPVQWALINGETTSGISVQLIDEKLDSGDLVIQKKFEIDENITAGELYSKIIPYACECVSEAIDLLDSGKAVPVKQDHFAATYCGKITRETARIDLSSDSEKIHNLVRALNPKPGAWCSFRGKQIKLWKTALCKDIELPQLSSGAIFRIGKKRLFIKTVSSAIEILEIQPENKKVMTAVEFINGMRLVEGEVFS